MCPITVIFRPPQQWSLQNKNLAHKIKCNFREYKLLELCKYTLNPARHRAAACPRTNASRPISEQPARTQLPNAVPRTADSAVAAPVGFPAVRDKARLLLFPCALVEWSLSFALALFQACLIRHNESRQTNGEGDMSPWSCDHATSSSQGNDRSSRRCASTRFARLAAATLSA